MCGDPVGYNNSYTTFRARDFIETFAGCANINQKLHICHSCLYLMGKYIMEQKQKEMPNPDNISKLPPDDWDSSQGDE